MFIHQVNYIKEYVGGKLDIGFMNFAMLVGASVQDLGDILRMLEQNKDSRAVSMKLSIVGQV